MTGEIAEQLLPMRRLRAFPRVVKRKMSSFGVKRLTHRTWPRPTLPPGQAIVVVGASKPAPIRRARRPSPAHPDDTTNDVEPAEPTQVIGIEARQTTSVGRGREVGTAVGLLNAGKKPSAARLLPVESESLGRIA